MEIQLKNDVDYKFKQNIKSIGEEASCGISGPSTATITNQDVDLPGKKFLNAAVR